jgi:hypothetical protein
MKVKTIKDIKDILIEINDSTLEGLRFGLGEGCEEDINLGAEETGSIDKKQIGYPEVFEAYPKLNDINTLIKNIITAQERLDAQNDNDELEDYLSEEGIDSEYKFK